MSTADLKTDPEQCLINDAKSSSWKRIRLPSNSDALSVDDYVKYWDHQNRYIDQLENSIKEYEEKLKSQDLARREHLLVVRLATKDQELQELSNQIAELKAAQVPSSSALKNALIDPAVNLIIAKLKKELEVMKTKYQSTQEELNAWKFTPDSSTGKRLMAKCRSLLQENEDLGKMTSSGQIAKLKGELAMTKKLCQELKKHQGETDEFVQEVELDIEGMQSTIYYLQQQLKLAKETIANLTKTTSDNSVLSLATDDITTPKEEVKRPVDDSLTVVKQEESEKQPDTEPSERASSEMSTKIDDEPSYINADETENSAARSTRKARATPTKNLSSPTKRGRPPKNKSREISEDDDNSQNQDGPGRPKRRRAAPQRFTGKEDPDAKQPMETEDVEEEK